MLKVWKKKWREQHHENSGEPGTSKSSSGSSGPAPPLNFQAAVPPAHSGTKRSPAQAGLDIPPSKKTKTDFPFDSSFREPDNASGSPNEVVVMYNKAHDVVETGLVLRIRSFAGSEDIFRSHFDDARHVGLDIGACAADLVWRRALKNVRIDVPPYSEDEADDSPFDILNTTKARIKDTVQNWSFTMPNLDSNSRGFNVSHKFLRLVQILESYEPYGEDFRGIVFVQRQVAAFAISDLVPMLGEHISFIRVHAIVDDEKQAEVFRKFKSGIYNLFVATQSIEDLDVPKAVVVIRFDLYEGDVSRAYSRSLTTGKTSHLVHMVERRNDIHRHNLLSISSPHPDMIRWQNILSSSPMSAAPPCPIVVPTRVDYVGEGSALEDPVAGGRIYLQDATTVVYWLASTARTTSFPSPLFEFSTSSTTPPSWVCTVLLPGTPAHNVIGPPCPSMAHARRAACFAVCVKLAKAGLLDTQAFLFRPRPHLQVQESTRIDGTGLQIYMRKGPDFWRNTTGAVTSLYPTIITVKHSNQSVYAPILLLTRYPLPRFSPFKLFLSSAPAIVETWKGKPFQLTDEKLPSLHMYTMRLCRAVANKLFICAIDDMPYFLAPLSSGWNCPDSIGRWELLDVADHIPWDLVARGAATWLMPLKYGRAEAVADDVDDAVIMDRSAELTRRYDVLRVRSDLTPLSCPEDCSRAQKHGSLLEYCKAHFKDFEGLKDEGQAIVEVSVLQAVSRLDPASRPSEATDPPRYLIPELCAKFTIPASTFRMALLFPSIGRRLDGFLLGKELNARFFNHQICETLLDMAITAPATRMEYDYERLELLGDSFLKYLASIYVFVNEPSNREGALHFARQNIISNRTLFKCFESAGLPSYVQSRPFGFKFWQPPNFRISNPQASDETQTTSESHRKRKDTEQKLGDKVVADVAEAILGAAYLSGGRDTALMAAKAMNLPIPNVEKWSDFGYKLLMPPPTISAKLNPKTIQAVEAIVHHKFKHPHLLAQALTHASVSASERVSYERLEFIGDAILDFLVIRYVFEREPRLSPGGLTLLKGAMVSNSALAAVCISSGLHNHILLVPRLSKAVADYVGKLQVKQTEEYELARLEQRPPGQYWHDVDPPKALSDVVESVIGAMYISDSAAPTGVDAFFEAVLKPFYDKHVTLKTVAHHPTKTLFELIQAQKCQKFEITKEMAPTATVCHVLVHNVILASGEGHSTALAAKNASWCALDALEGDADFFLRNCDCPKEGAQKVKRYEEVVSGLEE